jgi:hypothetical protein
VSAASVLPAGEEDYTEWATFATLLYYEYDFGK